MRTSQYSLRVAFESPLMSLAIVSAVLALRGGKRAPKLHCQSFAPLQGGKDHGQEQDAPKRRRRQRARCSKDLCIVGPHADKQGERVAD
jgi:hypothetical protein